MLYNECKVFFFLGISSSTYHLDPFIAKPTGRRSFRLKTIKSKFFWSIFSLHKAILVGFSACLRVRFSRFIFGSALSHFGECSALTMLLISSASPFSQLLSDRLTRFFSNSTVVVLLYKQKPLNPLPIFLSAGTVLFYEIGIILPSALVV